MLPSLALLALLAAAGGARAGSAAGDPGGACGDGHRRPTIAATTTTTASFTSYGQVVLVSPYGEDLKIYCSGAESDRLKIEDDMHSLLVGPLNTSTISASVARPAVGEYTYTCTDTGDTRCGHSLTVAVTPVMSLASPQARHIIDDYGTRAYFVPSGERYDVFCNANDIASLRMEYRNYESSGQLRTSCVNDSSVQHTAQTDSDRRLYTCTHPALQGLQRYQQIIAIVDYFPEGQDFQCTIYYGRTLTCSWKTQSKINSFKLFITHKPDGDTKLIYSVGPSETRINCTWKVLGGDGYGYLENSLTLQSCNPIFCNNQTFSLNSDAVLNLDPPSGLKVTEVGGLDVTLAWRRTGRSWSGEQQYRLEYKMYKSNWQRVNTSTFLCYGDECEFQLKLPCSDTHYEVRLFGILKDLAGNKLWSEPAEINFFTGTSTGGEQDPACGGTVMLLRKLISDEQQERRALRSYVNKMKEKLNKIEKIRKYLEQMQTSNSQEEKPSDAPPRVVCAALARNGDFNHNLKRYLHNECSYNLQ